jgi:ribosomal protein S12 methylthiotransferase accessory factor
MEMIMELVIDFPGGVRVDARFGPYTVMTDQPPPGGQGLAPTPFSMFLAALGTCAGYYVLSFCQQRQLPTQGLRLIQQADFDPSTHLVTKVAFTIQLPPGFPEKHEAAITRAAEQCRVSQQFEHPPVVEVSTIVVEQALA